MSLSASFQSRLKLLRDLDKGLASRISVILGSTVQSFLAGLSVTKDAIATTSTDGITLQNTTASTASATVQQTPRLRFRGHVWNTTTPADNTDDWFFEMVPGSGTTPTSLFKIGSILNGAAATFPFQMFNSGDLYLGGTIFAGSSVLGANCEIPAAGGHLWTGRAYMASPADGKINFDMASTTTGVGIDVTTDALLQVRTRAQSAYAAIKASFVGFSTISALTVTSNTIAPTQQMHQLGAGLVKTITVPAALTTGVIYLLPTAAFTYDATGNILVPSGGGTAVIDRLMTLAWNGTKWVPSY